MALTNRLTNAQLVLAITIGVAIISGIIILPTLGGGTQGEQLTNNSSADTSDTLGSQTAYPTGANSTAINQRFYQGYQRVANKNLEYRINTSESAISEGKRTNTTQSYVLSSNYDFYHHSVRESQVYERGLSLGNYTEQTHSDYSYYEGAGTNVGVQRYEKVITGWDDTRQPTDENPNGTTQPENVSREFTFSGTQYIGELNSVIDQETQLMSLRETARFRATESNTVDGTTHIVYDVNNVSTKHYRTVFGLSPAAGVDSKTYQLTVTEDGRIKQIHIAATANDPRSNRNGETEYEKVVNVSLHEQTSTMEPPTTNPSASFDVEYQRNAVIALTPTGENVSEGTFRVTSSGGIIDTDIALQSGETIYVYQQNNTLEATQTLPSAQSVDSSFDSSAINPSITTVDAGNRIYILRTQVET